MALLCKQNGRKVLFIYKRFNLIAYGIATLFYGFIAKTEGCSIARKEKSCRSNKFCRAQYTIEPKQKMHSSIWVAYIQFNPSIMILEQGTN
jgi:hypothetical protein